jgi:hypothetical protein
MFDQLSSEIVPSLTKGRHNNTNNNNKAKCIPGGTLRVLAGKNGMGFPTYKGIEHGMFQTLERSF